MVIFRELRITNTGDELVIDAEVRNESIYQNVFIKRVIIGTQKDYREGETNGIDVTSKLHKEDVVSFADDSDLTEVCKRVTGRLNKGSILYRLSDADYDLDLSNDLIFVYIITTPYDNPDCPNLPCDLTKSMVIGVTLNLANIYDQFMRNIDELNNTNCDNKVPRNLIDFILRYNALTLAIDSQHYTKAIEFYNKWFSGKIYNVRSNCGCNG